MDKRTREVRAILAGFISYELDGAVITAAKDLSDLENPDFYPGADGAFVLGVHKVMQQYTVQGNVKTAHEACIRAFANLGRRAFLHTAPDALVMLCKPPAGSAVVVTLEAEGKQLLLCIYTARTPLCLLRIRRMQKQLAAALPKTLKASQVTMTPKNIAAEAAKPEKKKPAKAEKQKGQKQSAKMPQPEAQNTAAEEQVKEQEGE